jgi:hypothetical protein
MDSALALRVSLYEKHTWENFKGYIIVVLQVVKHTEFLFS